MAADAILSRRTFQELSSISVRTSFCNLEILIGGLETLSCIREGFGEFDAIGVLTIVKARMKLKRPPKQRHRMFESQCGRGFSTGKEVRFSRTAEVLCPFLMD